MKILAVDTATPTCSVAIMDEEGLICELFLGRGGTHSAHLLGLIESALGAARMAVAEIDGFGVTIGPGSFTGLRIGLGVVKGLAFAQGRPAVGISSLQALAHPFSNWPGLVCPLLDARRGEVYFNRYGAGRTGFGPRASDAVGQVEEALAGVAEPCLFVGDGARLYRERIVAGAGTWARFAGDGVDLIRASAVGALARARLVADPVSDAGRLVPCYLRRADARDPLPAATRQGVNGRQRCGGEAGANERTPARD